MGVHSIVYSFIQKIFEQSTVLGAGDTAIETEKVTATTELRFYWRGRQACERNEQEDMRKGSCRDEEWDGNFSWRGLGSLLEEVTSELGPTE